MYLTGTLIVMSLSVTQAEADGVLVLRGHERRILSVAFSPNGEHVASGSSDRTARVWRVQTGKELVLLHKSPAHIRHIAYSPQGTEIAVCEKGSDVFFYEVSGWQDRALKLSKPNSNLGNCAAYLDDNSIITTYTATPDAGFPPFIGWAKAWNVRNGQELWALRSNARVFVEYLCLSPDRKYLAAGNAAGEIVVWDIPNQNELLRLQGHKGLGYVLHSLAFSPDGKTLATAGQGPALALWSIPDGKPLPTIKPNLATCLAVQFSHKDPNMVALGGEGNDVELWDLSAKERVAVLKGHDDHVRCLAYSRDGKLLATGSDDKTIRLWPIEQLMKKQR